MIDLCGTDIDPTLVVYDDCPTNGGVEIACNDDDGPACPGLQSSINLAVTTGTTYYIRVAGWGGEQGSGVLNIGSCAPTTPGCTDSTALNYNPRLILTTALVIIASVLIRTQHRLVMLHQLLAMAHQRHLTLMHSLSIPLTL